MGRVCDGSIWLAEGGGRERSSVLHEELLDVHEKEIRMLREVRCRFAMVGLGRAVTDSPEPAEIDSLRTSPACRYQHDREERHGRSAHR